MLLFGRWGLIGAVEFCETLKIWTKCMSIPDIQTWKTLAIVILDNIRFHMAVFKGWHHICPHEKDSMV